MNAKDFEIMHLKKMPKPINMLINKGIISIFRFSKISSFSKNRAIMSTNQGVHIKKGAFLLKSFKYHTPWNHKKALDHTLWPKLSYTLEIISPEKRPCNKISAKLIKINKESVKRSIPPTFQQPKKNEEKTKIHLMNIFFSENRT